MAVLKKNANTEEEKKKKQSSSTATKTSSSSSTKSTSTSAKTTSTNKNITSGKVSVKNKATASSNTGTGTKASTSSPSKTTTTGKTSTATRTGASSNKAATTTSPGRSSTGSGSPSSSGKTNTYMVNGRLVDVSDSTRRAAYQDTATNGFYSSTNRMDTDAIQQAAARIEQEDAAWKAEQERAEEQARRDAALKLFNSYDSRLTSGLTDVAAAKRQSDAYAAQAKLYQQQVEQASKRESNWQMNQRRTALLQEKARLENTEVINPDDLYLYDERIAKINDDLEDIDKQLEESNRQNRLARAVELSKQDPEYATYAERGNTLLEKSNKYNDIVNTIRKPYNYVFNYGQDSGMDSPTYLLTFMTEDEAAAYKWLQTRDEKNGTSELDQYWDDLYPTLEMRAADKTIAGASSFASKNWWQGALASATSAARSPLNGLAYVDALATKAFQGKIDPYSAAQTATRMNTAARSRVSTNINEGISRGLTKATGSSGFGNGVADVGSFLYDTGMSLVDSEVNTITSRAIALAIPGASASPEAISVISSILMGGGAASTAMQEAQDNGANDDQALAVGTWAGIFEALFEKVSIESFVKMSNPSAKGAMVQNVLKQMGIEASEEMCTEVADILSEQIIMDRRSQYKDATAGELAWQVVQAGLGGALSGAATSSISTTVGNIRGRQLGSVINKTEQTSSLIEQALKSGDPDVVAYARAMQEGTVETNDRNVGRLYAGMAEAGDVSTDVHDVLYAAAELRAAEREERAAQRAEQRAEKRAARNGVNTNTRTASTQQTSQTAENAAQNVSTANVENDDTTTAAMRNSGDSETNAAASVRNSVRQTRIDYAANTDTDEDIAVTGIHSVDSDGSVYVRSGDTVVSLGDVEFADPNIASVYERSGSYGSTETAQHYVSAYEGGNVEEYSKGFNTVYNAAKAGISYQGVVSKSLYAKIYLNEGQRMQAYAAGQAELEHGTITNGSTVAAATAATTAAATETATPGAAVQAQTGTQAAVNTATTVAKAAMAGKAPGTTAASSKTGAATRQSRQARENSLEARGKKTTQVGLNRLYERSELSENQRKAIKSNRDQLKVVDRIAKKYGTRVALVATLRGETIDGTKIERDLNGVYSADTDTVYISATAEGGAFAYFATHEMVHQIRAKTKAGYMELQNTVFDSLKASGEDVDALIRRQMDDYNYDRETAEEEVVCNTAPALLTDESFVRSLFNDHQGLFEQIRAFIDDLLEAFESLKTHSSNWLQDASLTADQVQEIADTFDRVATDAALSQDYEVDRKDGLRASIKSMTEAMGLWVVKDPNTGKISFTIDGKPVDTITADYVRENSGLGAMVSLAVENGQISQEMAAEQYQGLADIMNMVVKARDPEMVWAFAGSNIFTAVKANSDGQYSTTVDFTTVCRKTQEIVHEMSYAMVKLGRGLTKDEVTELQNDLNTLHGTVPCPVCYVFSRWAGIGSILDNMKRFQTKYAGYTNSELRTALASIQEKTGLKGKALQEALQKEDEEYADLSANRETCAEQKKTATAERNKEKKKANPDSVKLQRFEQTINDLTNEITKIDKRLKEIKASLNPEAAWLEKVRLAAGYSKEGAVPDTVLFNLEDAESFATRYPLAWAYRTGRGPSAGKSILPYSDFRTGDFVLGKKKNDKRGQKNTFKSFKPGYSTQEQQKAIKTARARVLAQNLIGGQRLQSTSDFRYDYALDYVQLFFEMQALGSCAQTYTKVLEFADLIALMGGDVNLSVMPKNKGWFVDENGQKRLEFSNITGIDYEAAKTVTEKHDNAQMILVGINDEHIGIALDETPGSDGRTISFIIPYHASGASINQFISKLVKNLGEEFQVNYYTDYSTVQTDSARADATADQAYRATIRKQLLTGKHAEKTMRSDGVETTVQKKWIPTAEELEYITGQKSKDISGMSFEELRAIEKRALAGDAEAVAEYESWSAGTLGEIYRRLWTEDGGVYNGVRLNGTQSKTIMPHEYWNKQVDRDHAYINGFIFRSYCYSMGLTPRFSGAKVKGEVMGDFTDSPGYWKTLIDRPMYDNNNQYRDQTPINVSGLTPEMLKPAWAEKVWGNKKVREPSMALAEEAAQVFVDRTTAREAAERNQAGQGKSSSGLKMSQKPVDTARLQKKNERLQEALKNARAQLKLTDGMTVDRKSVDKVARSLLQEYKSSYDLSQFSDALYTIFNRVSHGGTGSAAAWAEVSDYGTGVMRAMLEQSATMDTSVSEQYTGLKDILTRKGGIALTEEQKEQVAESFGSYTEFRREYKDDISLNLRTGVSLDTVLEEARQKYPDAFDANQSLVEALIGAAELTRPQLVNPYYSDMDNAAADLWLEAQQRYTETSIVQTFADKQKAKLEALRAEQEETLSAMREQNRKSVEDARLAERMAGGRKLAQATRLANERLEALRAKKDARIDELKAYHTEQMKKASEDRKTSAAKQKYKGRITASAKTLSDWLTAPSDKRFVPEELRSSLAALVNSIDMGYREGTKASERWSERMRAMMTAVEAANRAAPETGGMEFDEGTVEAFADLVKQVEDAHMGSIREMSAEQLENLSTILHALQHQVINSNNLFVAGRRQQIASLGDEAIRRAQQPPKNKIQKAVRKFMNTSIMNGNLKPIYFFKNVGGSIARLGNDLFEGQTKTAMIARDARAFYATTKAKYNANKWLNRKGDNLTFQTEMGDTITLNRGQAAFLLAVENREKLETHTHHLDGGGIIFSEDANGKKVEDATPHPLSETDMKAIRTFLTPEQIAFGDALVEYMSTHLATEGNRTSLRQSGYKKFTGRYYIPFDVSKDFIASTTGQYGAEQAPRLKNAGFTKTINTKANSPIMVSSIEQVFARHVEAMATYAGMAIPQDNLIRLLNYKQKGAERQTTLKSALKTAYGRNTIAYLDRLNADMGGRITADSRDSDAGRWLSMFKKSAVLGSASVVVQQPTAYFRAFSLINPLYARLGGMKSYREAQEYAGTAVVKDIGGFDMQTGSGMASWILDERPGSITEWSDEILGAAPETADALTWGAIWNSVKAEVHYKQGLAWGSEELLQAAGKRFDEVINYTQVYDSTLSRSDWMRNKSTYGSMITAFMAEPTTSMNLLLDAAAHMGDRSYEGRVSFIRAASALAVTTIVNAAVKSAVYAARDDDKYKDFWEKYLEQLKSALYGDAIQGVPEWLGKPLGFLAGSDFSPLTQVPMVSDVMSLIQGYDVSRTDLDSVSTLVTAVKGMFSENTTNYTKTKNLISAISIFTGIPVKNLWRDVEAGVRLFGVVIPGDTGSTSEGYEKLFEAIMSDGSKKTEKYRQLLYEEGKSDNDIDRGLARILATQDDRIAELYQLRKQGDITELEALRDELAETFDEEVIDQALKNYAREAEREDSEEEAEDEPLDASLYSYEDMETVARIAFTSGSTAELDRVIAEIKKDSNAKDPDKTIRNKGISLFKDEYLDAMNSEDAKTANAISSVLVSSFKVEQEDIDQWYPSAKAKEFYEALEAGSSVQELNEKIKAAKTAGKNDSTLINNVNEQYKDTLIKAWESGDTTTYSKTATLLKNLNLFDTKGKLYYTDDRFSSWKSSAVSEDFYTAIESGDSRTANSYLKKLKEFGRSDGEITGTVSAKYHDELVNAYLSGDRTTYNRLVGVLQSLDLHNKKGEQYYPDSKIEGWIEEARKAQNS